MYKSCKKEEKVQVTSMHNIFHKIIAEKYPNPDKESYQSKEAFEDIKEKRSNKNFHKLYYN
jgi:hypothetical protein